MTFAEMVEHIALGQMIPKSKVATILRAFVSKTLQEAMSGNDVKVPGLGKFSRKLYKERKMKAFGGEITAKAKTVLTFKPYGDGEKNDG